MDRSALLKEFGFKDEEIVESSIFGGMKQTYNKTGYPKPRKSYHLWWQMDDLSLEEPYFWLIDNIREHVPIIEKIEDTFSAAENSAFFGATQQRLGAQQDKISQFLATSGKMIKELFQMVRELRIIDERLDYYKDVEKQLRVADMKSRKKGSEITLKGMFVDLVQGGGKSAASVYGMARELEFITLPDLFFDAPPFKTDTEMENYVDNLAENFNENVLRVLKRHLQNYMTWKKRTHAEHRNRKRFMLQYLLQHFQIIKMYIEWIKPYLRHVERLTLKDRGNSPHLISSFEGSMLDIEFLARYRKEIPGVGGANGCVLVTYNYRTRPELKVVQEGYQRGPVHIGRVDITWRVYGWTDKQVEQYKKMKEKETIALMGEVSSSVQKAMEALGKELDVYLEEARKSTSPDNKETKEEKLKQKSLTERFLGDFYVPSKKKGKAEKPKSKTQIKKEQDELKAAVKDLSNFMNVGTWNFYKSFKKAHRMIMW